MKKSLILVSTLVLGLIFSACDPSTSKNSSLQLIETGKILKLPLDNETSNISDGIHYFDGDSPLIFNLNWAKNSIQIYDLKTKSKIKELEFDYEGPQGVLDVFGIYVHNLDSIFLFNQLVGQISLTDTSRNVYQKIKYEAPEKYTPAFVHNTYFLSKPILIGDRMIVKTHFHGQISKTTNDDLKEKELMYSINLNSGKTQFLGLKYPENYLLQGTKLFEPSIVFHEGKFVISYFGDHRIYFTSDLDGPIQSKDVKSPYLEETLPNMPVGAEREVLRSYYHSSPHYETLEFDPFRKVFIRFALHAHTLDPSVPVNEYRNYSGPFSIQVLDENLNLISEKSFEKNKYHPFDFFIAKEGIYISLSHPLNPNNKEDEFAFELIEFGEVIEK